jgi:hypothetical protein
MVCGVTYKRHLSVLLNLHLLHIYLHITWARSEPPAISAQSTGSPFIMT